MSKESLCRTSSLGNNITIDPPEPASDDADESDEEAAKRIKIGGFPDDPPRFLTISSRTMMAGRVGHLEMNGGLLRWIR